MYFAPVVFCLHLFVLLLLIFTCLFINRDVGHINEGKICTFVRYIFVFPYFLLLKVGFILRHVSVA